MRKLLVSMMVTLDGLFEGPNGDISWHIVDEEFNAYAESLLNSVDMLIFGRVTYQGMASYWPMPDATTNDPIIAEKMNQKSKIVFSKTLDKVEWQNTKLIKGDIGQEISRLKQQPGQDMVIFGSGSIVAALTQLGLIDEYRIFVNPVILGGGTSLFKGVKDRFSLKLLETRAFRSGNVLLRYQPLHLGSG